VIRLSVSLLLVAASCGGPPIPAVDLLLRVTPGAEEVELGRGFPLTVVRVWKKDLAPAEWNDRALRPLAARLLGVSRREDKERVEETRRYRCHAFTLDDVRIAAVKLVARPRDGGPEVVAVDGPLRVRVRRALDPLAPGPPELPGDPVAEPFPRIPFALAAVAAAVALLWVSRRNRRRAPLAAPAAAPPDPPHLRALARLREIRERGADPAAASAVVRDYLAERFDVRAAERTTEELLDAPPLAAHRDALAAVLVPCDLVKFAGARPSPPERARLLDAAEAFVEGSAG
jgi:hypothetical protein